MRTELEVPRPEISVSTLARVSVRAPGTCGELVQGTIGGAAFHVSSPIDLHSTVTVEVVAQPGVDCPADLPKAAAGAWTLLDRFGGVARSRFGGEVGLRVRIVSNLPRGKGMASSTADLAGVILAGALALGVSRAALPPAEIARLALITEPTDGSIFPGVVLFDHRRGSRFEHMGEAPAASFVVLDFGGQVDTIAFNAVDNSAVLRENEPIVAEALGLVRRGIRNGDIDLIGQGSTLSALANQRLLPRAELPAVIELARVAGGSGVAVGHSGTIVGIIVDPRRTDPEDALARARAELSGFGLVAAMCCRLIGGGLAVVRPGKAG